MTKRNIVMRDITSSFILRFGKYKGHSVDALFADSNYREYLLSQDWFHENNPDIVAYLMNAQKKPTPIEATPLHNRIQAQFLDNEFFYKVALAAGVNPDYIRCGNPTRKEFEYKGRDVFIRFETEEKAYSFGIEIKPVLGDDFPVALRQIQTQRCLMKVHYDILYTEEIKTSIPEDQVKAIFATSNVFVVTKAMVEDVEQILRDEHCDGV